MAYVSPRNCPKGINVVIIILVYSEILGISQTNTDMNQDVVVIIAE